MTVEITFRIVTGNHDENLGLESALEMNAPREFIYFKKNKKLQPSNGKKILMSNTIEKYVEIVISVKSQNSALRMWFTSSI